jgi:hypothetical protein
MSYDTKCYDLAVAFLEDYSSVRLISWEAARERLAQEIQTAIEDELGSMVDEGLIKEKP